MQKISGLTLAAALLLAMLPLTAAAQTDQIFVQGSGAAVRGTILAMSPGEVSIETNSGERKIPVNTIRKIHYAGEVGELRSARDKAVRGQTEDAVKDLAKIDMTQVTREVIKQDIAYYRAYCSAKDALSRGGDQVGAVRAMVGFINGAPGNYHFYEAAEIVGDLATAMGRSDSAATYYAKVAAAPWPDYQMKAGVLEGRALSAQGKFAEAQAKYEKVAAMTLSTPAANRQKMLAQIGRVECQAEQGNADAGIAVLEKIIAENDLSQDHVLAGRTYNALGACHRKANRPKDAILAYLHVNLLFRNDADSRAEALFYLSQLWVAVKKSERSLAARNLLSKSYAGTRWAKK